MRPTHKFLLALLPLLLGQLLLAQDLPPCVERPTFRDPPWVDGRAFCPEMVIQTIDAGQLPFVALAVGPDGTLYATRPLYGQVLAIDDTDGDLLPDTSRVIAEHLDLPNGLAYHDGALYIAGGTNIYRLKDDDLTLLVSDLPVDAGGWVGDLAVGPDERLYVSIGAGCDYCLPQDAQRGTILSFALDGTDRQVVAQGLRQAAGLAFRGATLWVTDSARTALFDQPDLDELNRVTPGANFGWPYCVGAANMPDTLDSDFDCSTSTGPAFSLPTGSTPLGIAAYSSMALPSLSDSLLLALEGSHFRTDLRGYSLAVIHFDQAGQPVDYKIILPERTLAPDRERLTVELMNYNGSGFWPNRPLDVAVSPQGYVYISVSGGKILALRPLS